MMHLPASVRIYLCASACDMRRSFDFGSLKSALPQI
jgi:hypothetical protein